MSVSQKRPDMERKEVKNREFKNLIYPTFDFEYEEKNWAPPRLQPYNTDVKTESYLASQEAPLVPFERP
jgi:hypothetical protein